MNVHSRATRGAAASVKQMQQTIVTCQGGSSRDRITAAARILFGSKGFHSTSIAELAAEAQVSVGLIYRLFESKEDIIAAIVAEDADERAGEIESFSHALSRRELSVEQAFERLAAWSMAKKDEALSLEVMAEAYRASSVGETVGQLCGRFRGALRSLAAHAHPDYGDAELDACEDFLLACLFGLGHRRLSCAKVKGDEAAIMARMICGALAAAGAVGG